MDIEDPTFVGRFYDIEQDKWFWRHADGSITLAQEQTGVRLPGDWPTGSKHYGVVEDIGGMWWKR